MTAAAYEAIAALRAGLNPHECGWTGGADAIAIRHLNTLRNSLETLGTTDTSTTGPNGACALVMLATQGREADVRAFITQAGADVNAESLEFDDDQEGLHANEFVFGWKRLRTPLMVCICMLLYVRVRMRACARMCVCEGESVLGGGRSER